ncbi:MAG: Crp/Fnr family transcriptional regulator [Parvularcula sp.]|jgi:CRP-like cAMP-binding protein|nr:Crp/Fnr family transcriptional regulator [Parvularcula sp.]
MAQENSALFRRLAHYGAVAEDAGDAIARLSDDVTTFAPGTTIIERGQVPQNAFVVIDGWASRAITLKDGRNQVVNFMLPGDFFDLQVFVGQAADHTVRALTELKLASIKQERITELFSAHAQLAPYFWWSAVQEEAILREQIVRNGRRSARERVAHLLLELHARLSIIGRAEQDSFVMPIGQTHVADALGMSYVHLSRVFSFLEKSEYISRARSEVVLMDREALENLADFSTLFLHLQPGRLDFGL